MSLLAELKRRNFFRAATAYAVVAWLLIQVAETILPLFGFDDTPARIIVIILVVGFVPAVILAWAYSLLRENDLAFEYLERAREVKDGGLYGILVNPAFSNIHDDPRWLVMNEECQRVRGLHFFHPQSRPEVVHHQQHHEQ